MWDGKNETIKRENRNGGNWNDHWHGKKQVNGNNYRLTMGSTGMMRVSSIERNNQTGNTSTGTR